MYLGRSLFKQILDANQVLVEHTLGIESQQSCKGMPQQTRRWLIAHLYLHTCLPIFLRVQADDAMILDN